VAGDEDATGGLCGVSTAQDGVDVGEGGGLADAGVGRVAAGLGEVVALHFEAVVAGGGDLLELGLDPVGCGADSGIGGEVGVEAREGGAVVELDEAGDGGLDLFWRDLGESGGDGWVDGRCGDGTAGGGGDWSWRLGFDGESWAEEEQSEYGECCARAVAAFGGLWGRVVRNDSEVRGVVDGHASGS